MKYAGILEPLLESIRRRPPARQGVLIGQAISLSRQLMDAFICLDSEGNLHFLLSPPAEEPDQFDSFQLRAMVISNHAWIVAGRQPSSYLDVTCLSGRYPSMQRPFLSFCEDLLSDLEEVGDPERAVLRTCRRWRRFWTEDEGSEFSVEWLRGLLGELAFLDGLVEEFGAEAVWTWTGPDAQDHDFQAGTDIAFEIKTGNAKPITINCNLNQLDTTIFANLFLVVFLVTRSDSGFSVVESVRSIEKALDVYEEAADFFYQRLSRAGYRRHLEGEYLKHTFKVDNPEYFRIDDSFPRLTLRSFAILPDSRISAIRYKLELSGLDALSKDDPIISFLRARLCGR